MMTNLRIRVLGFSDLVPKQAESNFVRISNASGKDLGKTKVFKKEAVEVVVAVDTESFEITVVHSSGGLLSKKEETVGSATVRLAELNLSNDEMPTERLLNLNLAPTGGVVNVGFSLSGKGDGHKKGFMGFGGFATKKSEEDLNKPSPRKSNEAPSHLEEISPEGGQTNTTVEKVQPAVVPTIAHVDAPESAAEATRGVVVADSVPSGPRKFKINLIEAKNLVAADNNGFSDPYVKVVIGGKNVFKTKVIKKNLNPVWNESYDAVITDSVLLDVYDDDMLGSDPIGQKLVTLADLVDVPENGSEIVKEFTLEKVPHGAIRVGFTSLTISAQELEEAGKKKKKGVFSVMGDAVGGVATGIGKGVGTVAGGVASGVGTVAGGVASGVGTVAGGVGTVAGGVASGVGTVAGGVVSGVGTVAGGVVGGIGAVGGGVVGGIRNIGGVVIGDKMDAAAQARYEKFQARQASGTAPTINIRIIEARQLASSNDKGGTDPYVVITAPFVKQQVTRVINKALIPVWNENFILDIESAFTLEVYDKERIATDVNLGRITLYIKDLTDVFNCNNREVVKDLPLCNASSGILRVGFTAIGKPDPEYGLQSDAVSLDLLAGRQKTVIEKMHIGIVCTGMIIAFLSGLLGLGWIALLVVMGFMGIWHFTNMRHRVKRQLAKERTLWREVSKMYPEHETVEWINRAIQQVWIRHADFIQNEVKKVAAVEIEKHTPAVIKPYAGVELTRFVLGDVAPIIDTMEVFTFNDNVLEVECCAEVCSKIDVIVTAFCPKFPALKIPIQVKNIVALVKVRIEIEYNDNIPVPVSKAAFCFLQKPVIDFEVKPFCFGNIMPIPGITPWIYDAVQLLVIEKMFQFPNKFVLDVAAILNPQKVDPAATAAVDGQKVEAAAAVTPV